MGLFSIFLNPLLVAVIIFVFLDIAEDISNTKRINGEILDALKTLKQDNKDETI
jgi:hypothetical protein